MEKGLSLLIYLLINGLFLLKYLPETALNPFTGLVVYSTLIAGVFLLMKYLSRQLTSIRQQQLRWTYLLLSLLTVAGILVLHQLIDPMELQVDRWSAIDHFLERMLSGEYPYLATTHLGGYGSPFPFWNIFHLPFYLMGDVAIGMTVVVLVLLISLKKLSGSYERAITYLLFLTLSPAFWYEVAVRSDLLYNFLLCFIICAWWYRSGINTGRSGFLTGVVSGLLLSSRLSIVIPFFIFLFPGFINSSWKQRLCFTGTAAGVFLLSFLPFIIWDAESLIFFEYNPFVLQSRQGSILEVVVLLAMLLPFSLIWKERFDRYTLYTSLTILIFVAVTFMHRMVIDNFDSGLFSSRYDISYFSMALPFVIWGMTYTMKQKNDL